jgi:hypothetical protein
MGVDDSERQQLEAYYRGLSPQERRARVILKPEFRDAYNELTQAHRQFPVPEYLWRWLPVIGPLPVVVYLQLRRYCFFNPETGEKRDVCWPSQARLANEVGVKDRKTLRKALVVLEQNGFIARERTHYKDAVSGRPRQGTDRYRVFFELPLQQKDAAELLVRKLSGGGERGGSYGGKFSPHRPTEGRGSSYGGKFSPRGGGEEMDRRIVTRTMTPNVENVVRRKGNEDTGRRRAEALALHIGESLNTWEGHRDRTKHPSEGYHRIVAGRLEEHLVLEALRATKDAVDRHRSDGKSCVEGPSAYFGGVVRNLADAHGINLRARSRDQSAPEGALKSPVSSTVERFIAGRTDGMDRAPNGVQETKAAVRQLVRMVDGAKRQGVQAKGGGVGQGGLTD